MNNEPKYITDTNYIGDLKIKFRGVKYSDTPGLDTEVKIEETGILCAITWNDKEAFISALNDVINRFRI